MTVKAWSSDDIMTLRRLAEIEGKSAPEIAKVFGITKSAVGNTARRHGVRLPGGQLPNTPSASHPYRRYDLRT